MSNILLDENSQKQLIEKGYVKTSFLSQEEVSDILDTLLQVHPDNNFAPNGDNLAYGSFHNSLLEKDIEYKKKIMNIIVESFSPHINKLFDNYEIFTSSFFIKPPGLGEVPAHQHFPLTDNINDRTVIIWCPLVDVDETNGTLQVVEGSHKIIPGIFAYGSPTCFIDYLEEMKKYSKAISLKAGECIIFDDKLIHWSGKNNSELPRITASALCIPKNVNPVFFHLDQHNSRNLEVLEIDQNFFIENRLAGDLIERPKNCKSLGFVENKYQMLSEDEFVRLLEKGEEIKPKIVINKKETVLEKRDFSFIDRIKSLFKKTLISIIF